MRPSRSAWMSVTPRLLQSAGATPPSSTTSASASWTRQSRRPSWRSSTRRTPWTQTGTPWRSTRPRRQSRRSRRRRQLLLLRQRGSHHCCTSCQRWTCRRSHRRSRRRRRPLQLSRHQCCTSCLRWTCRRSFRRRRPGCSSLLCRPPWSLIRRSRRRRRRQHHQRHPGRQSQGGRPSASSGMWCWRRPPRTTNTALRMSAASATLSSRCRVHFRAQRRSLSGRSARMACCLIGMHGILRRRSSPTTASSVSTMCAQWRACGKRSACQRSHFSALGTQRRSGSSCRRETSQSASTTRSSVAPTMWACG
mmetsp:Transcript_80700/g.250511  ORF Transcript_80700/g.250511 Transcript_80700/m.250511 type:complete len:307 (+) Transcript_80700:331-1251(+)